MLEILYLLLPFSFNKSKTTSLYDDLRESHLLDEHRLFHLSHQDKDSLEDKQKNLSTDANLLKQYEIYALSFSNLQNYRATINQFFSAIILTPLALLLSQDLLGLGNQTTNIPWLGLIICLSGLILSGVWKGRIINGAIYFNLKVIIIESMEKVLPAKPFSLEEEIIHKTNLRTFYASKLDLMFCNFIMFIYWASLILWIIRRIFS